MKCRCRYCKKIYSAQKSTADFTGYCSQKCLHAKAKECGYRKGHRLSEYCFLHQAGQIGNVPAPDMVNIP